MDEKTRYKLYKKLKKEDQILYQIGLTRKNSIGGEIFFMGILIISVILYSLSILTQNFVDVIFSFLFFLLAIICLICSFHSTKKFRNMLDDFLIEGGNKK